MWLYVVPKLGEDPWRGTFSPSAPIGLEPGPTQKVISKQSVVAHLAFKKRHCAIKRTLGEHPCDDKTRHLKIVEFDCHVRRQTIVSTNQS